MIYDMYLRCIYVLNLVERPTLEGIDLKNG